METGLIESTMSFEESLKQISPSEKNAKPIKVSLLKQLRKRYYWRLENNQWVVYDKKQNREFTIKPQRKPTYFSRWMNLVNISYQVFVYVVTIQYICSMEEELRIRISSKLKKELEAKAKELNISLSAYVRMKLSSND